MFLFAIIRFTKVKQLELFRVALFFYPAYMAHGKHMLRGRINDRSIFGYPKKPSDKHLAFFWGKLRFFETKKGYRFILHSTLGFLRYLLYNFCRS